MLLRREAGVGFDFFDLLGVAFTVRGDEEEPAVDVERIALRPLRRECAEIASPGGEIERRGALAAERRQRCGG